VDADNAAKAAVAKADAKSKAALVADAWATYIAHQKDKMKRPHIERGKKWGERHLLDHERLAQAGGEKRKRGEGMTKSGPLYPLLQLRMGEVSTNTLKDWMRDEAETRANNARQAFEMFRAFWRWCASRDEYRAIIDTEAVESKELRDEVPSRKSKRFDVMGREHLPAWFSAVHSLSNPVISAYLQILLLTGARREELAELRWQDVDFKWGNLWVKDKVMEEGRKIPLTPYVSFLLSNLKRINETPPLPYRILNGKRIENDRVDDKPSPWVFFSRAAADGRITEPRIPHNRALAVAGLPPLSIHGLRRTFKSLSEWVEMPVGIVAQIMGHKPSATAEKHYTERPLDLLKIWHSKYEAWILEQAGIQQPVESAQGLRVVGRE
jgi:integrase